MRRGEEAEERRRRRGGGGEEAEERHDERGHTYLHGRGREDAALLPDSAARRIIHVMELVEHLRV